MPKRIMPGHQVYVAHEMLGKYEQGPVVIDIRSDRTLLDPHDLNVKIQIYKRQVEEWFLFPVKKMLETMNDQASFVTLAVCLAYLEGVQQYRDGQSSCNKSKDCFRRSFRRTFQDYSWNDNDINSLYYAARCGLFHDGMTRSNVIYDMSLEQAFLIKHNGSTDMIHFQPCHLLKCIERDFRDYIEELQSNEGLRSSFDAMYSVT